MNIQCSLIQEHMLYQFELGDNATETTENICVKGEGSVDYIIVTRSFKKFCSGCKNLDNKTSSSRLKTMKSEAMLQAIEANPVSNT